MHARPLLLYVLVGLALAAACTIVFVVLGSEVRAGATQQFDDAVLRSLEARRGPAADLLFTIATHLGAGIVAIVIAAGSGLLLLRRGHAYLALLLVYGVIGGQAVNRILKAMYGRARPDEALWLVQVSDPSYPSGHAINAVVAYGTLAVVLIQLARTGPARGAIAAAALVLILLIGASRMYLGVHYPSDVVGGYAVGVGWVGLVAAVLAAQRFFASRGQAGQT